MIRRRVMTVGFDVGGWGGSALDRELVKSATSLVVVTRSKVVGRNGWNKMHAIGDL